MKGRARVAISIPAANPDIINNGQYGIHVGHARTLYLGKLIADELGVPYHVRLDGNRKAFGADLSLFVEDLVQCLHFLEVSPDLLYWAPQWDEVPDQKLIECFGERLGKVLQVFRYYPFSVLTVYDDIIHTPSTIIRGMEFVSPMLYNGRQEQIDRMQAFVKFEIEMFEAAWAKNTCVPVPLITVGGKKLAKSEGRFLHWSVLQLLELSAVRPFLTRTATTPEDPLSDFQDFKIAAMSTQAWEWDWGIYKAFCRGDYQHG